MLLSLVGEISSVPKPFELPTAKAVPKPCCLLRQCLCIPEGDEWVLRTCFL